MPSIIEKKIWPAYFEARRRGAKTWELRREDDCLFQEDDILILREFDPARSAYTGQKEVALITGVDRHVYGLEKGYALLTTRNVEWVLAGPSYTTHAPEWLSIDPTMPGVPFLAPPDGLECISLKEAARIIWEGRAVAAEQDQPIPYLPTDPADGFERLPGAGSHLAEAVQAIQEGARQAPNITPDPTGEGSAWQPIDPAPTVDAGPDDDFFGTRKWVAGIKNDTGSSPYGDAPDPREADLSDLTRWASEVRDRIDYQYKRIDGTHGIPNSYDGDVLRMVYNRLLPAVRAALSKLEPKP